MEKKHLILLTAGIVIAVIIIMAKKKEIPEPEIIKPGDKGNDVYGLQSVITGLTGLKFSNMGVYDNETLNAVKYYLQGSSVLKNYEKGYVSKSFGSDLYLIQSKVKTDI